MRYMQIARSLFGSTYSVYYENDDGKNNENSKEQQQKSRNFFSIRKENIRDCRHLFYNAFCLCLS